jgi:hypothetical protein
MLVARKLLLTAPVLLAIALAGCQTAGPVARSAAGRPGATQSSTVRPPVQAAKTDLVIGVGY